MKYYVLHYTGNPKRRDELFKKRTCVRKRTVDNTI